MKLCEVCQKPLRVMSDGHQRKRFCSQACRVNQGGLRPKVCSRCGVQRPKEMFSVDRNRHDGLSLWCKLCWRVYREQHVEGDDTESPLDWDGMTRLSEVRTLRSYQVVCLQAGHVMKRVRLTEFQAARIVIVGFRALHLPTNCDVCNGWLLLESDEDGQIGGGVQAHTVTGGYWWPESAA